jgi:hypothetical protein
MQAEPDETGPPPSLLSYTNRENYPEWWRSKLAIAAPIIAVASILGTCLFPVPSWSWLSRFSNDASLKILMLRLVSPSFIALIISIVAWARTVPYRARLKGGALALWGIALSVLGMVLAGIMFAGLTS